MIDEKKIDEQTNLGILPPPSLEEAPKQFLGGTLPYEERLKDGNWRIYRSKFEDQNHGGSDKMNCVSESGTNVIEEQINWLIKTEQIETEPIKEWLDENGLFESSQRFLAKMSGTTANGNTQMRVGDAIRKYGLLPEKDWPTPPAGEYMSWAEYYKVIPTELKNKALKILDYFSFAFEQIDNNTENLIKEKKQAPLWVAIATCNGWQSDDVIKACTASPNHAQVIDCEEYLKWWGDLDSYNPYEKKLAWNYRIYWPYKLLVNPLPTILKKKEDEGEPMIFFKKIGSPKIYQKGVGDNLYHWVIDPDTFLKLYGDFSQYQIVELDIADSWIGEPLGLGNSFLKSLINFISNLRGSKK